MLAIWKDRGRKETSLVGEDWGNVAPPRSSKVIYQISDTIVNRDLSRLSLGEWGLDGDICNAFGDGFLLRELLLSVFERNELPGLSTIKASGRRNWKVLEEWAVQIYQLKGVTFLFQQCQFRTWKMFNCLGWGEGFYNGSDYSFFIWFAIV